MKILINNKWKMKKIIKNNLMILMKIIVIMKNILIIMLKNFRQVQKIVNKEKKRKTQKQRKMRKKITIKIKK